MSIIECDDMRNCLCLCVSLFVRVCIIAPPWQPILTVDCVLHACMYADIGKLPWVAEIISQADEMVEFITNHHYSLALLRAHTKEGSQRELLKPGA